MRSAVLLLLAAATAAADSGADQAKAEAARANQLATSGDYVGAAGKFRSAYALDPKPEYLCDVGVAYQRAKQLPRAQIYLAQCLRHADALDAKFVDLVRQAVADGEAKLTAGNFAPVELAVVPRTATFTVSTFGTDERFAGSQTLWLPFGHHTIEVRAGGYEPGTLTVDVNAQTPLGERVELRPLPAAPSSLPVHPAAPTTEQRTRSKLPAIASTIVSAGAATVALGAYLHARSVATSAGSTTIDQVEYDRRRDSARTWQHASWALTGFAAAGAVISTLLWLHESQTYVVEVQPGAAGAAVSLTGSF